MHLTYRNVNDAFAGLVQFFTRSNSTIVEKASRNGPVRMIEEPVTITYTHPRERVLFNEARDANPFFHLYEALWMLAGRQDVAPLVYYNSKMAQFSDNGEIFNGAYGLRWRGAGYYEPEAYQPHSWIEVDQLKVIINHLKDKPGSRRAVLQMWNVEDDLLKVDSSKDVCCNLSALFSLREKDEQKTIGWTVGQKSEDGYGPGWTTHPINYALDMTVFNRSNDLILGALGANVVHFSMLQEYIALHLGVGVGNYHQVSNNLHVYLANWDAPKWLAHRDFNPTYPGINSLIEDPKMFDEELPEFVDQAWGGVQQVRPWWNEPFLNGVAMPMYLALAAHKKKLPDKALGFCDAITAPDWKLASINWLTRRIERDRSSIRPGADQG